MVEHSTADREVTGSIPVAPLTSFIFNLFISIIEAVLKRITAKCISLSLPFFLIKDTYVIVWQFIIEVQIIAT